VHPDDDDDDDDDVSWLTTLIFGATIYSIEPARNDLRPVNTMLESRTLPFSIPSTRATLWHHLSTPTRAT